MESLVYFQMMALHISRQDCSNHKGGLCIRYLHLIFFKKIYCDYPISLFELRVHQTASESVTGFLNGKTSYHLERPYASDKGLVLHISPTINSHFEVCFKIGCVSMWEYLLPRDSSSHSKTENGREMRGSKTTEQGARETDSSVLWSSLRSYKGPEFGSQNPHSMAHNYL